MPESVNRTPLAEDKAARATALVIIDMLSSWDFPDADKLLTGALRIAPRIAGLKRRCKPADVPVIYANDNQGHWRSDFRKVVAATLAQGGDAARIAAQLAPDDHDYFVLKPKQSAFYATPFDLLLRHLKARKLLLTGVSSGECVLYTAADAHMHDYEAVVPRDCVAAQTEARDALVLRHFEQALHLETAPAAELALPGGH